MKTKIFSLAAYFHPHFRKKRTGTGIGAVSCYRRELIPHHLLTVRANLPLGKIYRHANVKEEI
jgi:hypothetical protein